MELCNNRYSGLIINDISAAPGLCVTYFAQGCPHHCPGCHNPETWSFDGGLEFTPNILDTIVQALTAQGIQRTFCIMGGEPLCPENAYLTDLIIQYVKQKLPDIKIYIWSGYTYEELMENGHPNAKEALSYCDVLIDGRFIQEERDITLHMRGSRNQRIIELKN
jgi:anaerobic ribonucleoside-triphosphate reductase activating protein